MKKRLHSTLPVAGILILFIIGMALVQFSTPDMPDNDGFYHIKLAWLMRTEGLKPNFSWLPLTILNQSEFYDHHFLFHVALIPFTFFDDLRIGAKWAAVIFSALAFLAVWFLFHRQRIPFAWLWALALLGVSDAFLYRMSVTRAGSLSLAVLAIAFAWILERKYKYLAILAFAYVWMYDAFPLLIALAVLHMITVAIIEHRVEYKPLLYISFGILLGLVINPYFPENIIFSYRHMLPKLMDATSVRVGNEWFPYTTKQILDNSFPSLIAFVSSILALGLSSRKMDVRTAFALLVSLLFGLMLLQARRFVEYFPPFALIFAAFAWAPLLSDHMAASVPLAESPLKRIFASLPAILLSVAVAASIARSIPRAKDAIKGPKPYDLYADASLWLEENTPPDSRIFQTDWDDFPRLFYYNTHNNYLIGLDPTYMQMYDPNLYALWVLITRGDVKNPAKIIASKFGSQYIHSDLKHRDFIKVAENDSALTEVYRDDQAVIFTINLP
ncbi:MAG TPA: hypothetical protein VJ972_10885 [Anaerolineales bacterium]|nr:hypothetical protein [Anaerolineales bacterium]